MSQSMQSNTSTVFAVSRLALGLAAVLLGACGGGDGGGGTYVRPDPPPTTTPPTPPPPPPPASSRTLTLPSAPPMEAAPAPPAHNTTGSLVKLVAANFFDSVVDVSTAGSLTKNGPGRLSVWSSRFDAGVAVQDGELFAGNLFANVTVADGARLQLDGDIIGNVHVDGEFEPAYDSGGFYGDMYDFFDGNIFGNYSQSSAATMRVNLGIEGGAVATPLLRVSGTATLAGTLDIYDTNAYVTLVNAYLEWILHAYGGVTGTFATVRLPPGIFITGDVHYTPNDVYYLATRISTTAAMANAGVGDAMTRSGAAHVDDAFALADGFSLLPHAQLDLAQRRFLASATAIQRIDDYAQAAATFDSLSGRAHASAQDMLLDHAVPPPQLLARLDRLRPGVAGYWSQQYRGGLAGTLGDAGSGADIAGYDQWLGERLLLGGSVQHGQLQARFEREHGRARSPTQVASAYLHYRGNDGLYATGLAGAGRMRLAMDRTLDLAGAGRHAAHSERVLDTSLLRAEGGRQLSLGHGKATPFIALEHASLRSDGFSEAGDTGFELEAAPLRQQRTSAEAGTRYAWQWRADGGGRWLQFDMSGRYRRVLAIDGDPLRAAFIGAPQAVFDIDDPTRPDGYGLLTLNLRGGSGRGSWFLDYDRRFGGDAADAWWAGWHYAF